MGRKNEQSNEQSGLSLATARLHRKITVPSGQSLEAIPMIPGTARTVRFQNQNC